MPRVGKLIYGAGRIQARFRIQGPRAVPASLEIRLWQVPGPPRQPRIFRTNITSVLGRGLAVERQVEDKPQRAKKNLALRACCRRPAWTNKHRQKTCVLPPFSARIHDARDFRIPQSVDDRHHHLRWNNFYLRSISFGEYWESIVLRSQ